MERTCHRCHVSYKATTEHFIKDASRLLGISYECKTCHRARKLGRENRKDRYALMSVDQRAKNRLRQLRYGRTDKGRAIFLRQAYKRIDYCDLSVSEVLEIIKQPCTYCATTISPRGLDRIDNSQAHIKGNVLPACAACNFARGDRFSVAEMKIIGVVIRQVIDARHG